MQIILLLACELPAAVFFPGFDIYLSLPPSICFQVCHIVSEIAFAGNVKLHI